MARPRGPVDRSGAAGDRPLPRGQRKKRHIHRRRLGQRIRGSDPSRRAGGGHPAADREGGRDAAGARPRAHRLVTQIAGPAMKEADKIFAGSVPAIYNRPLGPVIFEPYAIDLAARVAHLKPQRILEIAAGTGIVSRAIARQLPEAAILATDLNQPMLDEAVGLTKAMNITYGLADAQALPFHDGAFDAAVCQFGVMFFPDKPVAFAAARRVLKPGGHYLFNVWDRIEDNEFTHLGVETLARLFPDSPPRFMPRTPH